LQRVDPERGREGGEETGLDVVLDAWSIANGPIDIDSHTIPANPKRNETEHYHHDFMYLARAREQDKLVPQLAEVHRASWVPIAEWGADPDERVQRVMSKLRRLDLIPDASAPDDPDIPSPPLKWVEFKEQVIALLVERGMDEPTARGAARREIELLADLFSEGGLPPEGASTVHRLVT
jgi:hypothetical protein